MSTRRYVIEVDEALVAKAYDDNRKNLGFALAGIVAGVSPEAFGNVLDAAGVRIAPPAGPVEAGAE